MTSPGSDRTAAYADMLAAVLAARSDPATARFDAEIAAAEAAGTLDGATARTLRWWQRESVRGLGDHVGEVLPGLLVALMDAERSAEQAVADSAAAWAAATGDAGRGDTPDDDPGPGGGGGGGGGGGLAPTTPSAAPGGADPLARVTSITPGGDGPQAAVSAAPADVRQPPVASAASPSAATGAPRQRLLVAGLTVLSDGVRPGDASSPYTR